MKLTFQEVDTDCLAKTKLEWDGQVASNPSSASGGTYSAQFAYWTRLIDGSAPRGDSPGAIYGVFRDGAHPKACALMNLIYAQAKSPKARLKLLELFVEPNLNLSDAEPEWQELAWIAATVVVGAIDLTFNTYKCKQLKIWANIPMTQNFLAGVTTLLLPSEHFKVSVHGNWMVVNR